MRTGKITYNVRERGRKFRGQDRNFDTVALAALVNGPEVQEQVAKGDLHGYFGHWPRMVFGMAPGEGGVVDGKVVPLEPALTTRMLRAQPDGTIEHEAEFNDTSLGRIAHRMFTRKRGGFSSAIAVREAGGMDVPIGFYGFDYVMEPNFSTNRGYKLDGVAPAAEEERLLLDDAVRESQEALKVLDGLYAEREAEAAALRENFERQAQVLVRVMTENAQLVDMVAKAGLDPASAKRSLARLDSAIVPKRQASIDSTRMGRLAAGFKDMPLAGFEPPKRSGEEVRLDGIVQGFISMIRGHAR